MGREIRRVPANWQHPKKEELNHMRMRMEERFQPLHNRPYIEAITEWIKDHELWERGEHPNQKQHGYTKAEYPHWADYAGSAPCAEYYRPNWKPEEMTWWQVYETVSEGTPVTPPFATREELVEYLVTNGDYWDQQRRSEGTSSMPCDPWTRKQAESFVFGSGWAPSLVVTGGRVMSGVAAISEMTANDKAEAPATKNYE